MRGMTPEVPPGAGGCFAFATLRFRRADYRAAFAAKIEGERSTAMSSKRTQLVDELSQLSECTESLREVLLHYKNTNRGLAARIDDGDLIFAALHALRGPIRRRELTEVLEEFEKARHRARVAMFALAQEQGTNISALGRALGISRQLASRLASEADNGSVTRR